MDGRTQVVEERDAQLFLCVLSNQLLEPSSDVDGECDCVSKTCAYEYSEPFNDFSSTSLGSAGSPGDACTTSGTPGVGRQHGKVERRKPFENVLTCNVRFLAGTGGHWPWRKWAMHMRAVVQCAMHPSRLL